MRPGLLKPSLLPNKSRTGNTSYLTPPERSKWPAAKLAPPQNSSWSGTLSMSPVTAIVWADAAVDDRGVPLTSLGLAK